MEDNDNLSITLNALMIDPDRTHELMGRLIEGNLEERELAEVSAELFLLGEAMTPAEFRVVLEAPEQSPDMVQVNAYSLDWLRRTHPEVFDNEG